MSFVRRHYWIVYPAWIVVCAALFVLLQGTGDPARPSDHLRDEVARVHSLSVLRATDPAAFARFDVVHSAYDRGPGDPNGRWVILCDIPERSALRRAVVVELDGQSGAKLDIRRPAGVSPDSAAVPSVP
ncbi:MAG: hypothetical protein WBX15_18630 [Thermoanaerobaculia bacterium]